MDYLAANTHRDGQELLNNAKEVPQSPSSPIGEDVIENEISGRSGGPCAPEDDNLGTCGHCHPIYRIYFACGCYITVCGSCKQDCYQNCPHCGCYRK
jgi:hypothetical protein